MDKGAKLTVPHGKAPMARTRYQERYIRTNVVKTYRPGYTWNKGGRLKELRIRFLARKFWCCWRQKTFGRVLPSVAVNHYNGRLLKTAFADWHALWWEARKEWRLSIRADLHNRYRLCSFVWQAWREYTSERHATTQLCVKARIHAEVVLVRRTLRQWTLYVCARRGKLALYRKAQHTCQQNRLRFAWNRWKVEYSRLGIRRQQETVALQVWAFNTTHRTWHIWCDQHSMHKHEQTQSKLAIQHHTSRLLASSVTLWRHHVVNRRVERSRKVLGQHLHRHFALKHHLWEWRRRWRARIHVANQQLQVSLLAVRIRVRRVITHWRHYVELAKTKAERSQQAGAHRRTKLLRIGLSSLHLHVNRQRTQCLCSQVAAQFWCTKLQHRMLRVWIRHLEDRMDQHSLPSMTIAIRHHSAVCVRDMWYRWTQYIEWRTQREKQYAWADNYYRSRFLPIVWQALRHVTSLSRHKRELADDAEAFRTECLRRRYLEQWHARFLLERDVRLMLRMAVLHHHATLQQRFLDTWKWRHQCAVEEAQKQTIAVEHHESALCRQMFSAWKQTMLDAKRSYACVQLAVRHSYIRRLRQAFDAWTSHTRRRRAKRSKQTVASVHHAKSVMHKMFDAWRCYHAWSHEVNSYVTALGCEKNAQLLRHAFQRWQTSTQSCRLEKQKDRFAENHFCRTLLMQVMTSWHAVTIEHAQNRMKMAAILDEATALVSRGLLRRTFLHWHRELQERHLAREQLDRAVRHRNRALLVHSIATWRQFVALILRKAILRRQSELFHKTRLLAKSYLSWRTAHQVALVEQRQTDSALWHWCLILQRKVLFAWLLHTTERRRKAKRQADALASHQRRLQCRVVVKMVGVADDLSNMRRNYAVKQGAEHYYKIQCLVRKFATHWRHLAATTRANPSAGKRRETKVMAKVVMPVSSQSPQRKVMARSEVKDDGDVTRTFPTVTSCVARQPRPKPRRPTFLVESLKREGLYIDGPAKSVIIPPDTPPLSPQTTDLTSTTTEFNLSIPSELSSIEENKTSTSRTDCTLRKSVTFQEINDVASTVDDMDTDSLDVAPSHGDVPMAEMYGSNRRVLTSNAGCRKNGAKLELLPPMAFMQRKDGTPLVSTIRTTGPSIGGSQSDRNCETIQINPALHEDHSTSAASHQVALHTDSGDGVAVEMTYIRCRLLQYEQRKAKLRTSREHQKQLIDWLTEQPPTSDDPCVTEVMQELQTLDCEISELVDGLNEDKQEVLQLAKRSQTLLAQIS